MKLPVGYVPGQGVVKATAYGGYGQRMLERMGWTKGQGLGKTKDGIKQAIEVTKKEDTLGVGRAQRRRPSGCALRSTPPFTPALPLVLRTAVKEAAARATAACLSICCCWFASMLHLLHGMCIQVGAEQQPGWDWNWKYWEDAYNSAVQKVDHVSHAKSRGSAVRRESSWDKARIGKRVPQHTGHVFLMPHMYDTSALPRMTRPRPQAAIATAVTTMHPQGARLSTTATAPWPQHQRRSSSWQQSWPRTHGAGRQWQALLVTTGIWQWVKARGL